jgi:hypothetical protein
MYYSRIVPDVPDNVLVWLFYRIETFLNVLATMLGTGHPHWMSKRLCDELVSFIDAIVDPDVEDIMRVKQLVVNAEQVLYPFVDGKSFLLDFFAVRGFSFSIHLKSVDHLRLHDLFPHLLGQATPYWEILGTLIGDHREMKVVYSDARLKLHAPKNLTLIFLSQLSAHMNVRFSRVDFFIPSDTDLEGEPTLKPTQWHESFAVRASRLLRAPVTLHDDGTEAADQTLILESPYFRISMFVDGGISSCFEFENVGSDEELPTDPGVLLTLDNVLLRTPRQSQGESNGMVLWIDYTPLTNSNIR